MNTKKHYYCMFNDILVTTGENINSNTEPNLETIAALYEAERIAKDPSVKSYTDLDTIMQAGYYDALANRSEDVDIVFTRIRKRIAKQSVKL